MLKIKLLKSELLECKTVAVDKSCLNLLSLPVSVFWSFQNTDGQSRFKITGVLLRVMLVYGGLYISLS